MLSLIASWQSEDGRASSSSSAPSEQTMMPALTCAEELAMQAWSGARRPRAPIKKNLMVGLRDNGLNELCDYPVNVALRTLRAVGSPKYRAAAAQTLRKWMRLTGGYENSTTPREWEETNRVQLRVQFSIERGENPIELQLLDEFDCSDEAFTEETHHIRRPFAEWCDLLEFAYKGFVSSRVSDPTISLVEFLALALAYIDQDGIDPANERTLKDWADSLSGVGIRVYDLIDRAEERKEEFMTLAKFLGEMTAAFTKQFTLAEMTGREMDLAVLRTKFSTALDARFDGLGTDVATTMRPRAYVDQLNSRVQQLIYEGDIPGMVGKYVDRMDELSSHGKELNDKLTGAYTVVEQYLVKITDATENDPHAVWTSPGYWFSITSALNAAEVFKNRVSELYLAIDQIRRNHSNVAVDNAGERNRLLGLFAETVIQLLTLTIPAFAPLLSDTTRATSAIGSLAKEMMFLLLTVLTDPLRNPPNGDAILEMHVSELGEAITNLMRAIDDDAVGEVGKPSLVQAYVDQATITTSTTLDGRQLLDQLNLADFYANRISKEIIKSALHSADASTSDAIVDAIHGGRQAFLVTILDPSLRSIRRTKPLLPALTDPDTKRRLSAAFGKDITAQVDRISAIKDTAFEDSATIKIHNNGSSNRPTFSRYRFALREFAEKVFFHADQARIVSSEPFWLRHRYGRHALLNNSDAHLRFTSPWEDVINVFSQPERGQLDVAANDQTMPNGSDDMHDRLYNTPPTIRALLFVQAQRRMLSQLENLKERDRAVLMRAMGGVGYRQSEAGLKLHRVELEETNDKMEKDNDFEIRTRETASKEATRFSQTFMEMVHVLQLHTDSVAMANKARKADERDERRRAAAKIANASRATRLRSHLVAMISRYYGDAMRCATLYKYVYAIVMCDDGTFTWQTGDRRQISQRRFIARIENPEEDYKYLLATIEQFCAQMTLPTPESRVRFEEGLDEFCRLLRGRMTDQWTANMENTYRHDGHLNLLKEKDVNAQRSPIFPTNLPQPLTQFEKNQAQSRFTAQLRVAPLLVNVVYEEGRGQDGEFFIRMLDDGVHPSREVLAIESVPWLSRGEILRRLNAAKMDVVHTIGEKTFAKFSPEGKVGRVLAWMNNQFEQFERYKHKKQRTF